MKSDIRKVYGKTPFSKNNLTKKLRKTYDGLY